MLASWVALVEEGGLVASVLDYSADEIQLILPWVPSALGAVLVEGPEMTPLQSRVEVWLALEWVGLVAFVAAFGLVAFSIWGAVVPGNQ